MVEGNKRSFGDLDDEEEDIFSSKKVTLSTSSCANFFFLFVQNDFVVFFLCCIKCSIMGASNCASSKLAICLSVFLSFDIEKLVMVCSKILKWWAILLVGVGHVTMRLVCGTARQLGIFGSHFENGDCLGIRLISSICVWRTC